MKIGFIGAGKVGFSLGKYLGEDNEVVGYASKSYSSAQEAAAFTRSRAFKDTLELMDASDAIFLTVPDAMISQVWNDVKKETTKSHFSLAGKIFIHCSGALSSEVFEDAEAFGVSGYSLHPLFAVSSKYDTYKELGRAFFAIEGSQAHLDEVVALVRDKGNTVQVIDTDAKVRYHAAAVLASNQVIALYQIACEQLVECGFTPENAEHAIAPLFIGNAEHLVKDGIISSLTGPAERGDLETINKHLACLDGDVREIYRLLNERLLEIAARKHAKK